MMEQIEVLIDVWVWMGCDKDYAYIGAATTQREALVLGHQLACKVEGVRYFHFAKGDVLKFENMPIGQNPYETMLTMHPELFKAA